MVACFPIFIRAAEDGKAAPAHRFMQTVGVFLKVSSYVCSVTAI